MKQRRLYTSLFIILLGFSPNVSGQESKIFDTEFMSIDKALVSWDPVRGKWLSNSIKAMSVNQPIPDRTFPEDYSPAEMLRLVPKETIENVRTISENQSLNSKDLLARDRWSRIYNYTNRPNCKLIMGRTYGDPHLRSYDGATYSFQTVGEFVLSTANNGNFEVQVRQEPQSDDFSLNTAVAMRVGGDRLGIYARKGQDAFRSPVMVNGVPIEIGARTYYLPHGGTVRSSGKNYLVTWPTGETVSIDMSHTSGMDFMNLAVQIYPCGGYRYSGLLGNGNGDRNDDFNTDRENSLGGIGGSMSQELEKERLAFLSKDFANAHRITQQTSLFDYEFGENTIAFTDYSYPRIHRTIHDIPNDRKILARNTCTASGIRGDELDACIYDQAFLNIAPVQPPVIRDHTNRVVLPQVTTEVPNVNPTLEIPTNRQDAPTRDLRNGSINTKPVEPEGKINATKVVEKEKTTESEINWDSRQVQNRKVVNETEDLKSTKKSIPSETKSGTITQPAPTIKTSKTTPNSSGTAVKQTQKNSTVKEMPKPSREVNSKPNTPKTPTGGGAAKTVGTIKRGG